MDAACAVLLLAIDLIVLVQVKAQHARVSIKHLTLNSISNAHSKHSDFIPTSQAPHHDISRPQELRQQWKLRKPAQPLSPPPCPLLSALISCRPYPASPTYDPQPPPRPSPQSATLPDSPACLPPQRQRRSSTLPPTSSQRVASPCLSPSSSRLSSCARPPSPSA